MAKCEICQKGPQFGHKVSHSNHHSNRQWKPNVQTVTIFAEGRKQIVKVCSRCLRTMAKSR